MLIQDLTNQELIQSELHKQKLISFIDQMNQLNKKICCITSGGTAVPLEKNTVRLLENFSTGLRGSLLAEQSLLSNNAVIFFYRDRSILPFTKGISINEIMVSQNQQEKLNNFELALKQYNKYKKFLLLLPFKSIHFYLHFCLIIKQILPPGSIFILCAAVSDFIPEETPSHKIHTSQKLELKFKSSPKILGKLVRNDILTVSFKLQTDEGKLVNRMKEALQKYNIHFVVGNILNKKNYIHIMSKQNQIEIEDNVEKRLIQFLLEKRNIMFKQI